MSIHRRIYVHQAGLLGLFGAACASQASVVPIRHTAAEGPHPIAFESRAEPGAAGLYTPKGDADRLHYSWQRETPATCASDVEQTVLKFSGSVGVFPLLSEAEFEQAQAAADAQAAAQAKRPHQAEDKRVISAEAVIASLRPRFRQCFSHWFEAHESTEGSVRFALDISCAGTVQAIRAEARVVDEPTVACLFAVIGPAQFEPPTGGHALLQVPVVFKNTAQ